MLFRGEDTVGRFAGTSRIGLAVSDDGLHFESTLSPFCSRTTTPGKPGSGPAVARTPGWSNLPTVASSPPTPPSTARWARSSWRHRTTSATGRKHGPAFASTPYALRSSKSGSIVTEVSGGRLVAARTNGRFWMYWGEGTCFAATSEDLVRWTPVEFDATRDRYLSYDPSADRPWDIHVVSGQRVLRPILFPRRRRFDSLFVEPGPPALSAADGIVLIYNGANHYVDGDPSLEPLSYQPGQALFDAEDPASCIARDTEPFLRADDVDAQEGQVSNVCFAQSLVLFEDRWHLYFGMADSRIGCAVAPASATDRWRWSRLGGCRYGNEHLLPPEGGPTVHVDDLPGDEAATLRRQPGGGETDLFWLSQPADGHRGKHPVELFIREVGHIGHQA